MKLGVTQSLYKAMLVNITFSGPAVHHGCRITETVFSLGGGRGDRLLVTADARAGPNVSAVWPVGPCRGSTSPSRSSTRDWQWLGGREREGDGGGDGCSSSTFSPRTGSTAFWEQIIETFRVPQILEQIVKVVAIF